MKKLILIIDDDPGIIETAEIILKNNGYDVVYSMSPDEGYKMVFDKKPDLIILDVMMEEPDDGFFLAKKLRKNGVNIPIVMYSSVAHATGMKFDTESVSDVNSFLSKPAKPEALLHEIEKYITVEEDK